MPAATSAARAIRRCGLSCIVIPNSLVLWNVSTIKPCLLPGTACRSSQMLLGSCPWSPTDCFMALHTSPTCPMCRHPRSLLCRMSGAVKAMSCCSSGSCFRASKVGGLSVRHSMSRHCQHSTAQHGAAAQAAGRRSAGVQLCQQSQQLQVLQQYPSQSAQTCVYVSG